MYQERLAFNGINGASGAYLVEPVELSRVAELAIRAGRSNPDTDELTRYWMANSQVSFAALSEHDPSSLRDSGWGLIVAPGLDPAVLAALRPLIDHRREQAGDLHKIVNYDGESKNRFLARFKQGPVGVDPERLPYYLLIVGDPRSIPFKFQYQLGVQYAVGRLWFETAGEYEHYARGVVAAERGGSGKPRRATLFGVQNAGDEVTQLINEGLVWRLSNLLGSRPKGWSVETIADGKATKAELGRQAGGGRTPSILFAAGHGVGFPPWSGQWATAQGALLCQEWPGPLAWKGPLSTEFYFGAADVPDSADVRGLIALLIASYSAGVTDPDDQELRELSPPTVAGPPSVSPLPRRLLGHPNGGALAVLGFIDLVLSTSLVTERLAEQQGMVAQSVLMKLMAGSTVGYAMELVRNRYAELAANLLSEIQDSYYGKLANDQSLAALWTAGLDARNMVLLGDPAVRAAVG